MCIHIAHTPNLPAKITNTLLVLYYAILCYTMLYYAILCYTMLYYATLC